MKYYTIFILLLIAFFSCESNKNKKSDNFVKPINNSKLKIKYSLNLETVALIYNLSASGKKQFEQNPLPRATLARKLTDKFAKFSNHKAVKYVDYLIDEGFVDLYDILLSQYSTPLPEFNQFAPYPSIYYENDSLNATQVQNVFNEFNDSVKDFYQDTKLNQFFDNNKSTLYAKLLNEVNAIAPDSKFIDLMEQYYGIERHSYSILVSAFSFNGIGKSATILTPEGINIIQFVASNPENESDEIDLNNPDTFTIGYTDKEYFQEIAIHELGHSFFHEALRENKDIISKVDELEYLFTESLKIDMRNQGYTNWRMCFEEHLVRLGEVKIAELLGNKESANKYLNYCIEHRGFVYMKTMQKIFDQYEANRDNYNSIQEFIPVLIERMKLYNKQLNIDLEKDK